MRHLAFVDGWLVIGWAGVSCCSIGDGCQAGESDLYFCAFGYFVTNLDLYIETLMDNGDWVLYNS